MIWGYSLLRIQDVIGIGMCGSLQVMLLEGQSAARFGWSACAWDQLVMLRFSQGMDKVGDGDERVVSWRRLPEEESLTSRDMKAELGSAGGLSHGFHMQYVMMRVRKRLYELVERGNMGSHYLVWGREFWVWTSQTGLLGESRNQRGLRGQVCLNVWAKIL